MGNHEKNPGKNWDDFTHLNSWAMAGDDSPEINHDEPGFGMIPL